MAMTGLREGGNAQLLLNENLLQDYVLGTRAVHRFPSLSIKPFLQNQRRPFSNQWGENQWIHFLPQALSCDIEGKLNQCRTRAPLPSHAGVGQQLGQVPMTRAALTDIHVFLLKFRFLPRGSGVGPESSQLRSTDTVLIH